MSIKDLNLHVDISFDIDVIGSCAPNVLDGLDSSSTVYIIVSEDLRNSVAEMIDYHSAGTCRIVVPCNNSQGFAHIGNFNAKDVVIVLDHHPVDLFAYAIRASRDIGATVVSISDKRISPIVEMSDLAIRAKFTLSDPSSNLGSTIFFSEILKRASLTHALRKLLVETGLLMNGGPSLDGQPPPGGTRFVRLMTKLMDVVAYAASAIVRPQDSFLTILSSMTEHPSGLCAVIDQESNSLSGVISEGDIRRSTLEFGQEIFSKTAADIMNRNPITINNDSTVQNAIDLIRMSDVTSLVVLDSNRVYHGIININTLERI